MSSNILSVLLGSGNSKIILMIIPWIAVPVINLAVLGNFLAKHQPNQQVDRVEVGIAICGKLESDLPVSVIPVRTATLVASFASSKPSIPAQGGILGREVTDWPFLPQENSTLPVVGEALFEKLNGGKWLAFLAPTTDINDRLIHSYDMLGFRSLVQRNTARGFAI